MGDLAGEDGIIQTLVMDAAENLSVQVHPDEAYAREHEHDHEKTESWYILAAEPGAFIYCGTTTDDVDALRAAAADDSIGERYGRKVPVSEGDFVLIRRERCTPSGQASSRSRWGALASRPTVSATGAAGASST